MTEKPLIRKKDTKNTDPVATHSKMQGLSTFTKDNSKTASWNKTHTPKKYILGRDMKTVGLFFLVSMKAFAAKSSKQE